MVYYGCLYKSQVFILYYYYYYYSKFDVIFMDCLDNIELCEESILCYVV
jgi:hypothetical protein